MPVYRLTIEYEGTRYSGWQTQANTPKTIQGHLERAAAEVLGEVSLGGAGRTDAGVHAIDQVAHLRCSRAFQPGRLQHELNDRLPSDIHVLRVEKAENAFHARHDAVSRIYLYQISRRRSAFGKPFVWWIRDSLNLGKMEQALSLLPGRHDFAAFADKRIASESTLVDIERTEIGEDGDLILIRLGASHFLWRMVRKLVGAVAEIGRGSLSIDEFGERLQKGKPRFEASAPAAGLFLEAVLYPGDEFRRPLQAIVPVWNSRRKRGSNG
jgi:tRNA pseudouridine38-40 synthase